MACFEKRNQPRLVRRAGLAPLRASSAKQWAPCCHHAAQSAASCSSNRDLVTRRKSRQVLTWSFSPAANLTPQWSSSGRSIAAATSDIEPTPRSFDKKIGTGSSTAATPWTPIRIRKVESTNREHRACRIRKSVA